MKKLLIVTLLSLVATAASAHGYKIGSLQIEHPWTRVTPKGAKVAGGYMKITNTGKEPDRLLGGTDAISDKFEIHEMTMDNGIMKMRPVPNGIEIKPGQTVELKPGGYHIMFVGIKEPVVKGKRVKGTLKFEKAGTVDVEYAVESMGATTPAAMGNMDHGDKGHGDMGHGDMGHGDMKMGH